MNIKKLLVSLFAAIVVASVCVFVSCEVGLGPAVDTQPPSLVIEKPEVDKVIRDKFVISGTWHDDGVIDQIYVLLRRTDGNLLDGVNEERKISATFTTDLGDKENGTWQAIVDPFETEETIIDGTYQATVVVNDKGSHSTTQNTTFTIDNTPPVLILSKPNSTPEDQTMSAYGQRLFLEGSIADSTKETWIQLDFYSGEECTEAQYLTTIETGMISPTDVNSNNARLAIYNTDLTQLYASEYYKLYGATEKSGSKQVYAKLTVYDTAETVPVEGESNDVSKSGKIKGNASQSFYLTKKLAESITKSQTANGYGLAPIDIYNVLNGTYVLKNKSRVADAQPIKEELLSDEQKKSISVFTINPENSPYFTISGLKTLNLDGKDFEEGNTIVNGTQTLEVSVFMGSDSIALKDDDGFYVYLLECDKYGKPIKEDVEANRIKLYSKYKETGSGSEKKTYYKVGGKTDHKTTSGAYIFSIPMNKSLRADPDKGLDGFVNINLEYGKNYIIRVSGKDTEENAIETTDNGYGFCFTAGGTAPRITITEPADNTVFIKKGDGLHVKGSVTSEGGEPRLTISNEENMVDLPLTQTGESTYTFEKQITPEELGFAQDESVIYSLIFSATRDAAESTQTKSVWYDVEGPAITMSDPIPLVKTNTIKADGSSVARDSVNGVISLSGSIIDAFDSRFGSASFKVEQDGAQVNKAGLTGSLTKNFDFTIDTRLLTDNKDAVIVITGIDYAGNINEERYTYYVDQSTDVPRIHNSETGKDITKGVDSEGLNYVKGGHNLFVKSGNLVLSVSDDDDIEKTSVKVQKFDELTWNLANPAQNQDMTYTSTSVITHTLPSEVAIYQVEVKAYDTSSPQNVNTTKFFIRVTGTGPDVTVSSDRDYVKTGGTYILTLSIVDEGYKPYTIKINDDDATAETVNADSKEIQLTPTTTAPVKFTVIDKNSSFSEKFFNPKFDDEIPSVTISSYPSSMNDTEGSSFLFKGTASDDAGAGKAKSGIKNVEIMFSDKADSTIKTEWLECNGSENWNYEAAWASTALADVFASETEKTVTVRASDGAGNEITSSQDFTYDKMAPTVTIGTAPEAVDGKSDLQVAITITDTNPVKPTVTVKNEAGTTLNISGITVSDISGDGSAYTSTMTLPFKTGITDGTYIFEVIGHDQNGRNSQPKQIKIKRDAGAPTVTIENPSADIEWAQALTDKTYTFKVKSTDGQGTGTAKLYYAFKNTNSTPADDEWTVETASDGDKFIPNTFAEEGEYYIFVKAEDKSGNVSGVQSRKVSIDTGAPTLTVANPLDSSRTNVLSGEVTASGYTISGTLSDTNKLSTAEALVIKVGGVTKKTMTAADFASSSSWSYTIAKGTAAGTIIDDTSVEVEIIAKDITGKSNNTVSKKYNLYYDTKEPELTVSAPADDEPVETAYKAIKGTVNDDGYGIDKIEYVLYSGTITSGSGTVVKTSDNKDVTSANFPVEIKGEQWYIKRTDTEDTNLINTIPLGTTEGALTLKVIATEKKNAAGTQGGRSTSVYVPFYYDRFNPTLTETEINTRGATTNAGFVFNGKVWDTNGLDHLEITDGTTIWTSEDPAPTGKTKAISLTKRTSDPGEGQTNWSANFKVGSETTTYPNINDGTQDFTITAYDITGKTKQLSRTVVVDTQKPIVDSVAISSSTTGQTINGVLWYTTTSIPVEVAVTEKGLSGISKVEYQIGTGDWTPLSFTNNKYQGTISFASDGAQSFKIKATDVAGNVSDISTTDVNIDTTAPNLTANYYKLGTDSVKAVESSIYVKTSTQITVYGNYDDAQSGIQALTFAYGSPTVTYSTTAIENSAPVDTNYSIAANAITGKETTIKSWKAVFTPSESDAFTVSGSNRTNNPTGSLKVFDVTVDGEAPVVDNVKLIEVKAGVESPAYSDGTQYYVNNITTGKTFKISGVATDTVGVHSVELLITKDGSTTTTKTATRKGTLGQWYFDGIDLSDWTGGATAKVIVKDKAGNSSEPGLIIKFDVTAPATVHLIDDSQKNLEFRIGDAPNDAGQEDVGGKYSNGSYGSALTMQLRGNFPDNENGSGINKFYYKTFNNEEVKIDDTKATTATPVKGTGAEAGQIFFKDDAALIAYVVANKTDVFSPIAVETKNVEYNMNPADPVTATTGRFGGTAVNGYTVNSKGYVQFRTSVSTNFKTTMKGFVEGKNYLVIVAEDNAGNLGLDTATVGGVEYPCYSLNVDITAPTIPATHEGTVYTNVISTDTTTETVMISGTVSDAPKDDPHGSSGVKEIVFTSNQNSASVKLTGEDLGLTSDEIALDSSAKPWTVDVCPLLSSEGTAIISATVTDNAGFSTSKPVANITVDKTGPTVAINSPAANAVVGKTFTISGIANDGNGAGVDTASGLELWYKVASGDWTKYTTSNPNLTGQNWTCDVNAAGFVNDGANTAVSFKVKAKDKSGTGNPGESAELTVTVDTKAPDAGTFNVEETAAANLASTWFNSTTVNINGSFTDAGGSGVRKVYYQVKAAGSANYGSEKSVTSDGSYTINIKDLATGANTIKVYAEDSVGNKSDANEYTVKVDDKAPTITSGHSGVIYANSDSCLVTLTVEDLGGSTIDKVMLTVGDKDPVKCDPSEGNYTKDIKPLLVEGTVSVTATASDKAGNTASKVIANVMLDKTGPTVVINTPAADAKTSNQISISGSASDGVGSGVNTSKGITLYYTTDTGAATPTDDTISSWTKYEGIQPTLTGSTWTGTFNVPDAVAPDIANTDVYICAVAVDNAGTSGNAGYSTPVKVTVDRNKPVYDPSELRIGGKTLDQMTTSPWFKDTTLEVKGKFTDEGGSGVTKIFYQVDSNPQVELATSDGSFNTNISGFEANSTLKIWAADAVGNSTEGDKKSYTIKVDGTAPVITSDITGINYSNANAVFPVSLAVSDAASGIASVVLSRDGTNTTVPCTLDEADGKYKAADISSLLPASGNTTIMATATDNAGNTASTVAANILVDKTEPSVSLTAPADADTSDTKIQVNGTISLSGTSSDENVISRVVGLLYKKDSSASVTKPVKQTDLSATDALTSWSVPDGWTKVAATLSNANATTNWTFNGVNTAKLDGTNTVAENSSIWFTVAVQDTAGNIGYSDPVQVYAKQDSDRPVITLSQLTKNTVTTLKTKNVYGSLTDDDGTLEKLWYWNGSTAPTTAPSYNTTWTVPTGWKEITINGGSWSIDSTEEDGQTTWYFAVADAKKTVFATVGNNTFTIPYIKYTDETNKVSGTASGVTFKYDTNPPTADSLYLYRADAGTTTSASDLADADAENPDAIAWTQAQNLAFGHNYNKLYAKVVVTEGTGMKALTDAVAATETSPAVAMSSPISISYKNLEFSQIEEVPGTGTAAGTYTYYLGPITMDTTEQHDFKVTVEDAVGNKGYISRSIIVDNEEPTSITEVKPKSTVEISDVFTYRGNVSDNTGGSGVTKVEWYIPKSTESDATVNTITWKEASLSAGWEIDFSGDNNLSKIIDYIPNGTSWTVDSGYSSYETSSGSGVYAIPVWFKITDVVGNIGYNKENFVRYNPNTDRPSVQITSPSHNKTATISGNSIDYAIMGGTAARISGNADDNEGIAEVYLQFDLDDDGKWDNGVAGLTADMSALPGDSATFIAGCPWTKDDIKEIKYQNGTSTGYFGIKVSGTKNWSYTLDLSDRALLHITETKTGTEPNVTYTYEGQTIKVRAIAVDNDDSGNGQLVSAPSAVINISVNNDIPLFSNLKLKQIDSSNNVLSEIDYTDGKYLTGENWHITGDVYAYGGISAANYTGVTDAKDFFTAKVDSEGTESTTMFDMIIPIEPDASGKWDSTITVYDNNSSGAQPNQQKIIIHIDNDPPTFNDTYTDEDDIAAYGTAKHYLNSYGARGTLLTPTVKIQDTNGLASIWGKVTDTGSGFDKAVFYFKRFDVNGTSNPRIYNPMEQTNNRTNIVSTSSVGSVYINSDGLPALVVESNTTAKMTVSRPESSDNEIQVTLGEGSTVSGIAGNKNVRKGGLIKIGGVYRTITDVDYTSGIVTFNPPCDRSFVNAEIIYAMVVDSTGETMTGNTINEEDGDGMQENFSEISGTVTWNAAIKTSYIPDGPLELHVVAFDTAGNISNAYTKTGVNNNPLRLTKVMLGTDLNADNTYSTSEYESFYAITTSRGEHDLASGVERWDLDTRPDETSQYFTVKKGLSVIPEFVGGTGDVYYKFKKGTTDLTEAQTLTTAELATNKLAATSVAVEGTGNKIGQFSLASDTIGYGTDDADEDKMHIFSFSFWDSTESSTAGQNSSWTVLNAKIHQDLRDGVAPTGNITPFYWRSKAENENSLVWSGSGSNATALGHIELENDLPTGTFTADSGEYDKDPKVSGQIYIKGTAFDETRLGSITVTFANKSVTANYTPGSGWSQVANGYGTITITDAGPAQSGHSVTWKWLVNTAEVVTDLVAATDKTITVSVKDANPNTSATSSTQTTSETPTAYYRVDIVPYITKISTGVRTASGLKDNNIRSASGKYSILANNASNTITVSGFNFATAEDELVAKIAQAKPADSLTTPYGRTLAATTDDTADDVTTSTIRALTITQSNTNTATITNSSITKSGYLELFSNGVRALNNINGNDAYGTAKNSDSVQLSASNATVTDYEKAYNREPDYYTTKNVQLTDDRYLRFFDMKDTGIKNGYYPVMMMGLKTENQQLVTSDNPVFGYVDLNGMNSISTFNCRSYNRAQYMVQRAEFNASTGKTSDIEYLIGGMTWDQMAMSRDSKGHYMHVSVFNQNGSSMSFVYDRFAEITKNTNNSQYYDGWGGGSVWQNWINDLGNTNYNNTKSRSVNTGNNAINMETVAFDETNPTGGESNLVGRYQGMKIRTTGDSTTTNGAINYLAYYDDNTENSNIIFRTFKVRTQANNSLGNAMTGNLSSNLTEDDTSGRINAASNATKYLDLGVTSDGYAVIVYYDKDGKLRLVHSDAAVTGAITGTTFSATNVNFTSYIGQYVSMAIDSSNHIHIAAFDANKSTLRYIYLENYNDTTPDEYTVDASTSVGKWTQIKIHNGKPYIAYYNNAEDGQKESIRLAYLSSAAVADGYDASGYATGAWEYMTVPSLSPAQGGDTKFQSVCLDFDSAGTPVVGYLGTNLEFGKWLGE